MYKILLLITILIAFIASCLYFKLDEFVTTFSKEQQPIPTQIINTDEPVIEPIIEEIVPMHNENKEPSMFVNETDDTKVMDINATLANANNEEVDEDEQIAIVEEDISPKVVTKEELQESINNIVRETGVVFQRMSSEVTTKSLETIEAIANILKNNPQIRIEIAGHTDARGDDQFNLAISEQRAVSVKNIFVELGIDENRLVAKGYGEAFPLVPNDKDGYSLVNRRVEFNIVEGSSNDN